MYVCRLCCQYTPHGQPGIYVRTLLRDGAASCDGRVQLGDRILAVNGHSIVGADYHRSTMRARASLPPPLRNLYTQLT